MSALGKYSYKSRTNCCVFGCHSRRDKNRSLGFYSFPRTGANKVLLKSSQEMDRRQAWEYVMRSGKQITNNMKVCSLHFKKEDFIFPDSQKRKTLKKTAIPSLNLPNKSIECKIGSEKLPLRLIVRDKTFTADNSQDVSELKVLAVKDEQEQVPILEDQDREAVEVLLSPSSSSKHLEKLDKSAQIGSSAFFVPLSEKLIQKLIKQLDYQM